MEENWSVLIRTKSDWEPDDLQRHLKRKEHKGGNSCVGLHPHHERVRNRDLKLAQRIDVHPLAIEKISWAEVVFFSIEGCMKADSILSQGAAVFSVPSVSLWNADELQPFVQRYLLDKEVVIVCDADWFEKAEVASQARSCHGELRQLGVERVTSQPPPLTRRPGAPTSIRMARRSRG